MKKTTVAGLVAGVLALACAGGGFLLANMAEEAIRARVETLPGYGEAHCDDVRVSLLRRSVRIANLRLRNPEGEILCRDMILRPRPAAALAAVPFLRAAMLPSSVTTIAGDAELRDITARMDSRGKPPVEVSLASLAVSGAYLEAALFRDLLDGRPLSAQDFSGKAGSARIDGGPMRLRQASPSFTGTLERFRLRDSVLNASAALFEIERFSFASTEERLSGSLLRLTDIAVPPAFADRPLFSAHSAEALWRTLDGAAPLFRSMPLENASIITTPGETVESRRVRVLWHGNAPLHTVLRLERLCLPASLPRLNGLPAVPGLDQLLVDLDWEHLGNGESRREDVTIDVTDMGRMDAVLEHTLDLRRISGSMLTLLGAQLHRASLRYEDRGGLARLLALSLRHRDELSRVDMLAEQLPALLPGGANRPLVEALRTTLLTPGTLELRLRDGMALTALDMLDVRDLGRKIEASATPGKENVKEQLLRLLPQ